MFKYILIFLISVGAQDFDNLKDVDVDNLIQEIQNNLSVTHTLIKKTKEQISILETKIDVQKLNENKPIKKKKSNLLLYKYILIFLLGIVGLYTTHLLSKKIKRRNT